MIFWDLRQLPESVFMVKINNSFTASEEGYRKDV
jgi:hypothetical protein